MNDFVIETKQLTKVYRDQTVVSSVNLHVKKGQIYGLLGRNGAGKTTIMKMILGLTSITQETHLDYDVICPHHAVFCVLIFPRLLVFVAVLPNILM